MSEMLCGSPLEGKMMVEKHTPGPWEFDAEMEELTTPLRIKSAQVPIATIELGWDEPFESEQQANARLISAAPELLEALRRAVLQNSHDMMMTGDELRKCNAAIAKATGATSAPDNAEMTTAKRAVDCPVIGL